MKTNCQLKEENYTYNYLRLKYGFGPANMSRFGFSPCKFFLLFLVPAKYFVFENSPWNILQGPF